jgi:anti-sigma regulatory factor (Ser/Thr protein kinase)
LASQTTKINKAAKTEPKQAFNYQLEIKADLAQLALVRDFISKAAKNCFFSHRDIFDITLATNEAVANAIEHGSARADSIVKVSYRCVKGNFIVKVKDTGRFSKVINMNNNGYRGRGIMLMLALMDRVAFDETPQGTEVYLIKKCHC